MYGAVFVVSSGDETLLSYYTNYTRLDNLSGILRFQFPGKQLDTLKYLVIYKFALQTGADHDLTVIVSHHIWALHRLRRQDGMDLCRTTSILEMLPAWRARPCRSVGQEKAGIM